MNGPIRFLKREDADVLARSVVERTASRGCVEVHGLSWTSPALLEWENKQREMGNDPKVDVRVDELDLGIVYIDVPERGVGPFRAWSRQPQFTEGLSIAELNRLKKAVKDKALADRLGRLTDDEATSLRVEFYAQLGRGDDPAAIKRQAELQDALARLRLARAGAPAPEPPVEQTATRPPKGKAPVRRGSNAASKPSGSAPQTPAIPPDTPTNPLPGQPPAPDIPPNRTPKPRDLPRPKYPSLTLKRTPQ